MGLAIILIAAPGTGPLIAGSPLPQEAERQESPSPKEQIRKDETGKKAVLFKIEGQLTQTMRVTLKRAINRAQSIEAEALIVELNTPGGEIMLMEQLRNELSSLSHRTGIETVAFINPSADSAGALVAISCTQIYMIPSGNIGSATPVPINPLGPLVDMIPTQSGQEDMMNKIKGKARAMFRATADDTGRNPDLAEAMVDPEIELVMVRMDAEEKIITRQQFHDERARGGAGRVIELFTVCPEGEILNLTATEAMNYGFIDGIVETRDQLVYEVLDVAPDGLIVVDRSWSEQLVEFIESIHFLLIIAGIILLYVEFQIPGFGIPGIIGLCCLALVFVSKWLTGLAEFTELILIVIGAGLILVEIFAVPGTFISGIVGAVLIVVGILFAFQPFIVPTEPWEVEFLKDNLFSLGVSLIAACLIILIVSRFLPRTSIFQRLALSTENRPGSLHGTAGSIDDVKEDLVLSPGDRGVAKSTLRPAGKALIQGDLVDVQSEGGFIDPEEEVVVVRVSGNFVFVRKYDVSS